MTYNNDWEALLPTSLESVLSPATHWVGKPPEATVPSFLIGSDGPYLGSIYCVFGNLLCEVRLKADPEFDFDFVRIDTMRNLRVVRSSVKVGEGESEVSYESVRVTIRHYSDTFMSELSYLGDDGGPWLEHVQALLPLNRLKI